MNEDEKKETKKSADKKYTSLGYSDELIEKVSYDVYSYMCGEAMREEE